MVMNLFTYRPVYVPLISTAFEHCVASRTLYACVIFICVHGHSFVEMSTGGNFKTSAEPGRKSAYSNDIRWGVVWQRIGMGLTFHEIAVRLSLSLAQVCYVRIQVRLGRICGFQECDQIATPLTGFSCAACVTNTSAAMTSELLPYLLYSVGMHA